MRREQSGFTLVELLIVVMVLGILAGVVLPKIGASTSGSKEVVLATSLARLREALELYRVQHDGAYPGYNPGGSPTATKLVNHLTLYSNAAGQTRAVISAKFPLGPYLRLPFPINPINALSTVTMVHDGNAFPPASDLSGWTYKAETGELRANCAGTDSNGKPFAEY